MRRAGFTLVEMCVVLAIFAIVMMSGVTVVRSGQRSLRHTVTGSVMNTKVNRALNRIVRRVRSASSGTVFPQPVAPFASDNISFQQVEGWEDGALVLTSDTGIVLEYEPAETDNDVDDDGDGFVDECQVVLVENLGEADEQRVVLVASVREFLDGETPDGFDDNGNGLRDERGLCFAMEGNRLVIRLSVMHWNPDGNQVVQTLETSVGLRN